MTGHGGDIYGFAEKRMDSLSQINVIDFSASINPLGTSRNVILEIKKNLRHLIHYPDNRVKKLTDKIAETLNIDPEYVFCGNGSTELIYLIPRVIGFKKVLLVQPTFSDYERACRIAYPQCVVTDYLLERSNDFDIEPQKLINYALDKKVGAVFICNPNNPTGRLVAKEGLLEIVEATQNQQIYLIVDESFIDFCQDGTVAGEVKNNPYLIVLRSMTKFYALAGLRLGYGIFPPIIAGMLKKYKEPWSVNALAQAAGIAALNESSLKERTMKIISRQKRILEKGFRNLGIDYVPSHANYYLLCTPHAQRIAEGLSRRGIMVRDCSNFKGLDHRYLRIAVKSQKENGLLLKHMEECIE